MNLKYVKVGDTVRRQIADSAKLEMELKVTNVTDNTIECGPWVFDRVTGAEIDEELHWGPSYGQTGSMIQISAYGTWLDKEDVSDAVRAPSVDSAMMRQGFREATAAATDDGAERGKVRKQVKKLKKHQDGSADYCCDYDAAKGGHA